MFFYLARQPILDADLNLYGYELLFRDGEKNAFPNVDADIATTSLIQNTEMQHSLSEITGKLPAFINFAEGGLLNGMAEYLNPDDVVIEILESVKPTAEVRHAIKMLHKRGYRLALDDYDFAPEWLEIFPYLCMIKVDLQSYTHRKLQILKYQIRDYDIQLLAEKVENQAQFHEAVEDGFSFFQGYFFSRPEMIKRRHLNPTKAACTELLAESARTDFDFQRMAIILQRDVALSYRLLRFVNAAAFGLREKVTSLQQAVIFLGADEVNRFVTMAITATLADDKPNELIRMSIARARFCELISQRHGARVSAHQAFIVGLFSMLDAMFDEPLESALNRLNLSEPIVQALLHRKGPLAFYLGLIVSYEQAHWRKIEAISRRLNIPHSDIAELYLQASEWSSEIVPPDSRKRRL
ncbi:EAL and HDOD domain-containing protein [Aliidiomarina maris]|uniref:EAL and modified HD-GYP domain-containing signal transduction protein n=1 Tax=Aliidiomarina maris TaxID=531312 RepID=A0A327X2Z8_9GAMM|nr:HDOD domain-containing protein [Aliidiomarina maris]MBA3987737.1 EAL domain-containing protein [Idiomarina sp.]MCL5049392.1 HDOD domain-containing protein [Bacillota bacterium]RAK01460.1 EAL and modified HD-GYP domain-containing signal transduction protein [Aliidiomarina maris]RUO28297.1 EAL domain-containing protein [Aliidiomarina maris]